MSEDRKKIQRRLDLSMKSGNSFYATREPC